MSLCSHFSGIYIYIYIARDSSGQAKHCLRHACDDPAPNWCAASLLLVRLTGFLDLVLEVLKVGEDACGVQ